MLSGCDTPTPIALMSRGFTTHIPFVERFQVAVDCLEHVISAKFGDTCTFVTPSADSGQDEFVAESATEESQCKTFYFITELVQLWLI